MKLREWCNKNRLGYKILLADNGKNVNRLKRIANKEGYDVINLEGTSLTDLARRIVIEKAATEGKLIKVELADHDTCVLIINQLIKGDTVGNYSFIPKESICIQTAEEILRVINELRMGDTTQEFDTTSVEKEKQIKCLIKDYEKVLRDKDLYDKELILREATEITRNSKVYPEAEIGLLSFMLPKLSYAEREFISSLKETYVEIDCERESDVTAVFYEVYGQANEMQMVISEIHKNRIPYGKVNIVYSSTEYETVIRAALSEREIPYSFISGCSIRDRAYISFMLSLISWAKDDYSYDAFKMIANSSLLRISKDYTFGRKAYIGWGLDRYLLFVDKMTNGKNEYLDLLLKHKRIRKVTSPTDGTISAEECSNEYLAFLTNLTRLFRELSKPPFEVGNIYRQLLSFIRNSTYKNDEEEKFLRIMEGKRKFFDLIGKANTFIEALDFIYDEIASLKTQDDEQSNAVTVMQMGRTEVLERPYQFCIGMSYDAFGVRAIDSPVLSDERMSELINEKSGYVVKTLNRNLIRKESLFRSLSSMPDGVLTVSACKYDTRNFRETAVSEAFIELKAKYGCTSVQQAGYPNRLDPDTDYRIDKNSIYKNACVSGTSSYTNRFISDEIVNGFHVVKLENLSPSALQIMMECPLKFEYSMKYFEKDNPQREVTVWLHPNEKGNFFHQVFQKYCNEKLVGKAVSESDDPDINRLKEIFDELISEYEILVPKGSIQAYELEKKTIWDQIEDYIGDLYKDLKTDPKKWIIKECEREFTSEKKYIDDNGDEVSGPGTCDVIEFSYHGFLDRIDTYIGDDGTEYARIIDYKTGKKDTLEKKINKNTQIQHAIYSMAVEEEVDYFSYVFPCDGNTKIEKSDQDINELPRVYRERMADILLDDNYMPDDEDACKYCDYKDICLYRMNLV